MIPASSKRISAFFKSFILAFAAITALAQEAPPGLAKHIAARAAETRKARLSYTYRQSVTVDELTPSGGLAGQYHEIREVTFSPETGRTEQMAGRPKNTLKRLRLTPEDFEDVRSIQPFLFDEEQLWAYQTRFKGEENVDGVDCWVLQVRPKQILDGQRLFDGMVWADKKDYSIVRTVGKAVPERRSTTKEENLFPTFTTVWEPVDGTYRFPVYTYADDTLDFRVGPQRIRLKIRYSEYKKFGAESRVTFEGEKKEQGAGSGKRE